ncbi:UDP-Gal:betaGlcNAc beta 1,4- galactosyltransferase, polypeptide 3 [Columba livia]|uniref:Beta-1,4-galactosyltransferase n=1 Tax=Columba livia TaxID=8932 RepID=A0A2I0LLT4_COLLI|nr:UDP-Gal:betaGlcNAc beta 1,4- galactosyltransferase, polypeptide 3 [Columba livia]
MGSDWDRLEWIGMDRDKVRAKRFASVPRYVEMLVVADETMSRFHGAGLRRDLLTVLAAAARSFRHGSLGNADLCGAATCATLGMADVGTMCDPERSCAIVEDDGLQSAFTAAHELGHVFNMLHDTSQPCRELNGAAGAARRVMAPVLSSLEPGEMWSPCSARFITDFLDNGHASAPHAVGPLTVTFSRVPTLEQIRAKNPAVQEGGRYQPPGCEPRSIVPHRNRESHLGHLLYYLHPFLQRQQLQYGIYVVHQAGNSTFNRAKLLNVGVKEALKDEEWDCLFLHDVDLIPENDHNLYVCDPWNPKHVSIAMNKFGYSLPYPQYFGGVSALTPDQYMKINGFPNEYWGWGGEDDDIATRVRLAGMKISPSATTRW